MVRDNWNEEARERQEASAGASARASAARMLCSANGIRGTGEEQCQEDTSCDSH